MMKQMKLMKKLLIYQEDGIKMRDKVEKAEKK